MKQGLKSLLEDLGNKIIPVGRFIIGINPKNENGIIVYPIEEAVLEDPGYMVIGRYETEERTTAVFKCLLDDLLKMNYYYMPNEPM